MEKKEYKMPQLKAWKMEDNLMAALSTHDGEGNGNQLSKETVMDDEDDFQGGSKSVWDD